MKPISLIGAGLAVALMGVSLSAHAHAHLDHAMPGVGSTVTPAPREVVIFFTEALEGKFSSIVVRDAKGAAVQDGVAGLDPGNRAQLRIKLKPLPPGTYKVFWRILSVDTHRSQGAFSFRVRP